MKSNKPKVSFMEDSLFWESSILYNVVDRVKSYSLSRSVETEEKSGYKYIHYGDIHTGVAQIVSKTSILPSINLGNYEFLEKGDLILADASEDYQGIAKPAVIIDTLPYKLVAGLHTIALRPKNLDSLFLYYTFYSRDFRRHGYRTGTGMKVFGISTSNLLKYELKYPSKEVQSQIGRFFKNLDDTISLHQQELEALRQTKQGFLQKMFPQEGQTMPTIRFNEFKENWEKYSLGQIGKIRSGVGFPEVEQQGKEGIPFYKVSDLNLKDNNIEMTKANNYVTNQQIKIKKWSVIEELPAIIFAKVGAALMLNRKKLVTSPFLLDNNLMSYSFDSDWDAYFGYSLFQTLFLPKYAQVGALPSFNGSDISTIEIYLPSLDEQYKIGEFFRQLDEVIELKEKETEALKETKKGFLQKMFV